MRKRPRRTEHAMTTYADGWDDLRAWMRDLGLEAAPHDAPGALRPLMRSVSPATLEARLGRDRMRAFLVRLQQELATGYRETAALGREFGSKFENVPMLEQAHQDEAAARALETREDR
jgi:hypothetical protein